MVLVDTSVWIGHFRKHDPVLAELLNRASVIVHPFVLGELACGNFKNRGAVLTYLKELPEAVLATQDEVLRLIEDRKLWGKGIGWVDAHLLASALLSNCPIWTLDERLAKAGDDARLKKHQSG
jgi:predicted nucleic acid-binding protein